MTLRPSFLYEPDEPRPVCAACGRGQGSYARLFQHITEAHPTLLAKGKTDDA